MRADTRRPFELSYWSPGRYRLLPPIYERVPLGSHVRRDLLVALPVQHPHGLQRTDHIGHAALWRSAATRPRCSSSAERIRASRHQRRHFPHRDARIFTIPIAGLVTGVIAPFRDPRLRPRACRRAGHLAVSSRCRLAKRSSI